MTKKEMDLLVATNEELKEREQMLTDRLERTERSLNTMYSLNEKYLSIIENMSHGLKKISQIGGQS